MERKENRRCERRGGGGHWMKNVIHDNAGDEDDTKHMCCRDEGQTMVEMLL